MSSKKTESKAIKLLALFARKVNLGLFLLITVIIFLTINGGDILSTTYNIAQSEGVKDGIQKYTDFCNIVRHYIPSSTVRWGILLLVVLSWIDIIYFRLFYKEPEQKPKKIIHVLGHASMGKTQLKSDSEFLEDAEVQVEQLDLIEEMGKAKEDLKSLSFVICNQDSFVKKFKDKINSDDYFGYMGIAHTPLILRAGYQIGDEIKFILFHKLRNSDYFKKLSESKAYAAINIEKKDIKKDSYKELIVAISTTFPIQDNQLHILEPENKSIIKFKTEELGFDVIISQLQIEEYVSTILKEVRQIVSERGIFKIHLVISSSAAFTFALGQAISNHYDPQIVIYHFDYNNEKLYPWGVELFKDCTECVVIK